MKERPKSPSQVAAKVRHMMEQNQWSRKRVMVCAHRALEEYWKHIEVGNLPMSKKVRRRVAAIQLTNERLAKNGVDIPIRTIDLDTLSVETPKEAAERHLKVAFDRIIETQDRGAATALFTQAVARIKGAGFYIPQWAFKRARNFARERVKLGLKVGVDQHLRDTASWYAGVGLINHSLLKEVEQAA